MLENQNHLDAALYSLVHELIDTSAPGRRERRSELRMSFIARQRIAPWSGEALPAENDYFDVQCYDLTRAGFSFIVPRQPPFTRLVARFGISPTETVMGAIIRNCRHVVLHDDGTIVPQQPATTSPAGHTLVLVGCRFTHRIELDPTGQSRGRVYRLPSDD